jgi:hypothetical protein
MSQDLLVDPSCNNQTSGCLLKIGVNKAKKKIPPTTTNYSIF